VKTHGKKTPEKGRGHVVRRRVWRPANVTLLCVSKKKKSSYEVAARGRKSAKKRRVVLACGEKKYSASHRALEIRPGISL